MALRSLYSRPLVTGTTLFSLLLPTALLVVLLVLRAESESALKRDAGVVDVVVGAKGSPLQLVLSTLYLVDQPTGNIPYEAYQKWQNDKRVARAIPLSFGDNYEGFRLVGTTEDLLEWGSQKPLFKLQKGRFFIKGFEAVLGAQVAASASLQVGDPFHASHGLLAVPGAEQHDEFTYRVVGTLEPTGTALDRAIFVPQEAVWKVHHAEQSVHHVFGSQEPVALEITAFLLQLHSAGMRLRLVEEIRAEPSLMAAVPLNEILRFSQVVLAPFQKLLLLVVAGVGLVASLMVFLALLQSAQRRQSDLAILRCLGARKGELFELFFYEVLLLVATGLSLGWLLGRVVLVVLSSRVQAQLGLVLSPWSVTSAELLALGGLGLVALLVGTLPLFTLYKQSPLGR